MSNISSPKLTSPLPDHISKAVSPSSTAVSASSASQAQQQQQEKTKKDGARAKKPIRICVFCSTQRGGDPVHVAAATRLAQAMHEHRRSGRSARDGDGREDDDDGIHLVYGGGSTGLMGAVARERVRLGGPQTVMGVVPYALVETERGGRGKEGIPGVKQAKAEAAAAAAPAAPAASGAKVGKMGKIKGILQRRRGEADLGGKSSSPADNSQTDNDDDDGSKEPWSTWSDVHALPTDAEYGRAVGLPSLARRKEVMVDMVRQGAPGSGFIVLPGGFGSLDEVLMVLTARQLGFHSLPLVLCNVAGFWDGLVAWMRDAGASGFLGAESRGYVKVVQSVDEAVACLVGEE